MSTNRARWRGQTLVLGAVTMLVLALMVMLTLNITMATHAKINLQNYADAKAYSTAVQEARALNYFAYSNRAIASAYVGMANLHAYMSEAAMQADLKMAAAATMGIIAAEEIGMCFCCAIGPCCFDHCVDSYMAQFNAAMLVIDWVSGGMGQKIRALDAPAGDVMDALHNHIGLIHLSQEAVKLNVYGLLVAGSLAELKEANLQKAGKDETTSDEHTVTLQNAYAWNQLFYDEAEKKRQIMAEVTNASRQAFAWNRHGSPIVQGLLFPPNWVQQNVKATVWLGDDGLWAITQTPDFGFNAGGRTGFTNGDFPLQVAGTVIASNDAPASDATGETVNSFDWGVLAGQWKHGAGVGPLPLFGPLGPGELLSGSGDRHRADLGVLDFFNRPHDSADHGRALEMERFIEFKIETRWPYNQPSTFAAASTDSRVTETGIKGPWEINDEGTVAFDGVGETGELVLANKQRTKAFSKAMVYYHRIGDWQDYPNLFNPFWRAKLHPLSTSEILTSLTPTDPDAAMITGAASAVSQDTAAAVNVAR